MKKTLAIPSSESINVIKNAINAKGVEITYVDNYGYTRARKVLDLPKKMVIGHMVKDRQIMATQVCLENGMLQVLGSLTGFSLENGNVHPAKVDEIAKMFI